MHESILKEISPGISLEGMMLKLKLQYFGHLMRRVDSLEKTLMLGGIATIYKPMCVCVCIYIYTYIYMYIAVLKIISNSIIYFIKPLHGNKDNLGV